MNPYRTKKGPNIIPHHARICPGSKTQREMLEEMATRGIIDAKKAEKKLRKHNRAGNSIER